MTDENLILYLPMDDPDGSQVAYDYSKSRADAQLSGGAYFTREAKIGKALCLDGGEALTDQRIPFSDNFTLSMYVKPTGTKIGWLLNFPGIDNYLEQWIECSAGSWILLTFVKEDGVFTVYNHLTRIFQQILPGEPTGLALCDDTLFDVKACIDEVTLYNTAKSIQELIQEKEDRTDVEYYVNGQNFKDFGVYVSASSGLVGQLERKEGMTEDWGTRHGLMRGVNHPRYKERTITLECFIEASSRAAFVEWQNRFFEQFRKKGTQRLTVEYAGTTKPLVYEVTMQAGADPEKQWGGYNSSVMVGTFTLTLVEDDPVKMVLRHVSGEAASTAQISLTSYSSLLVFWGDGSVGKIKGEHQDIQHTYDKPGEYDIIIAGLVEEIQDFSTSEIIVWQKLM